MELQIIYEDDQMIVINKQAGVTVNKADTTRNEVTVQDAVESYLQLEPGKLDHERDAFYDRGGIVHRLDKETSGALLIAKTPEAFVALQSQFKERTVQKTYTALVHGIVSPAEGEINVPVGRLDWNRKRFGVIASGREATTKYKTEAVYELRDKKREKLSLMTLYPKTGRTHQIRVHMKYLNNPIFADFLYAGRKTARDDRRHLARVFLHASSISFMHPSNPEEMHITVPLAQELKDFLEQNCTIVS